MHIKGELYWLVLTIIFLVTACQPKRSEAWLLENYESIKQTVQPMGLIFYTNSFLENRLKDLNQYSEDLNRVNYSELSAEGKLHYLDLKHLIDYEKYLQDTLKVFQWDATQYRIAPQIRILADFQVAEKERFTNINELLAVSDSFYQIAKDNITDAISIESGKLAVDQHAVDFLYLQNDLARQIEESTISEKLKEEINRNLKNTMLNIKDYIGYVTSMINNTDDLDDTTNIITKNIAEIRLRKYLGRNIAKIDIIGSWNMPLALAIIGEPVTRRVPELNEILERDNYYFTIEELTELEQNENFATLDFIVLLAQQELDLLEDDELSIPLQKMLDDQSENMKVFPYRYTVQVQNYLMYQQYKDSLEFKKMKNEKMMAMDAYIRKFKQIPFIFMKQVLEE